MRPKPLSLALLFTALDALWALQAFSAIPRNEASTVSIASLAFWSVLHLPAGIVGSLLLKPFGYLRSAEALPAWALAFYAGLGLVQAFALSFYLTRWFQRRKAA